MRDSEALALSAADVTPDTAAAAATILVSRDLPPPAGPASFAATGAAGPRRKAREGAGRSASGVVVGATATDGDRDAEEAGAFSVSVTDRARPNTSQPATIVPAILSTISISATWTAPIMKKAIAALGSIALGFSA